MSKALAARNLFSSPSSSERQAAAVDWLRSKDVSTDLLVVGASREAALEVVRMACIERGAFGWRCLTLGVLARELAAKTIAAGDWAPASALALVAVAARTASSLEVDALGRYRDIATAPGFPRALSRSVAEARAADLRPDALAAAPPELRSLADAYDEQLRSEHLADASDISGWAAETVAIGGHPFAGVPLLLYDVPVSSLVEERLVRGLIEAAANCLATVPGADEATLARIADLFPDDPPALAPSNRRPDPDRRAPTARPESDTSLARLQRSLFGDPPVPSAPDHSVQLFSAPGIARECVEIARRVLARAREGVPFDQMAVLVRAPTEYQSPLQEAFNRAQVPTHFARGVALPDPSGRAIMALLRCRLDGLSARRFAEYLSVDELPARDDGAPPPAPDMGEFWSDPDDMEIEPNEDTSDPADPPERASFDVPRRWERLLGEAAVVGGRDRWARRLGGLDRAFALDLAALEDPDDPAADRIARDRASLAALSRFALPLLDDLAEWPVSAPWSEHLARLSALATRSLRHPDRVLAVASSLAPLGPVGPVTLRDVVRVLDPQLLALAARPSRRRHGAVFVAPIESARGLAFDTVFVPGLAERLMPRKVVEEPLLLDSVRTAISPELPTNARRGATERLLFALAAGSARRLLYLSYPHLDTELARPRVPSFYTLEAKRAAEGVLPPLDELQTQATAAGRARAAWPAPEDPALAIDEAEFDLALLESVRGKPAEERIGTARYLLGANPHLARAMRARAQRWRKRWYPADGLVEPGEAAALALAAHRLSARSYSPTALQNFAICPYKFYLHAILRLAPRAEPVAIDALDPLQRGSLIHEVQFQLLTRLRDAGRLPVTPESLSEARTVLDLSIEEVARAYEEDLAPAISRVWSDGVEAVRADLSEWLRRAAEDDSGWVPWRFELTFGLPGRRATQDEHSVPDAVELDQGVRLRGSIDVVERRADGSLRVTDHKTGRARVRDGQVIGGGTSLQPVLYALVAEKIFDSRVDSGRLYFCTTAEAFAESAVPLDERARHGAAVAASAVDQLLAAGSLPAYPLAEACRWCDYRPICGPREEERTRLKPAAELAPLLRLRGEP